MKDTATQKRNRESFLLIVCDKGDRTEFGVVTNIRRANLSHDRGWVILEVVGTTEAIEKSLTWAKEQGVRVEPATAETAP